MSTDVHAKLLEAESQALAEQLCNDQSIAIDTKPIVVALAMGAVAGSIVSTMAPAIRGELIEMLKELIDKAAEQGGKLLTNREQG